MCLLCRNLHSAYAPCRSCMRHTLRQAMANMSNNHMCSMLQHIKALLT